VGGGVAVEIIDHRCTAGSILATFARPAALGDACRDV